MATEKDKSVYEATDSPSIKPIQEKELLVWIAPARPFKRRNRDFYVTIIAIAGLFGLVLYLIDGFMPVILIISLVFLLYVMSTIEPENVSYSVTNKGIKMSDVKTPWEWMGRFWFTRRFDNELLVIEADNFSGRIELVVKSENKEELKKILSDYLLHEQVPPSFLDRAASWFSKRLPVS